MDERIRIPRRQFSLALAGSLGLALPLGARAQKKIPDRPIMLTVPFAPGGSNDIMGRAIAERLSTRFNHNVVVENRPGAGSVVGAEHVARARPDGTSLLLISAAFTMTPAVTKLSYDPLKSFVPVAMLAMGPSVIAVTSSFPANTVQELIDYTHQHPGKVFFGSAGVASFQHFAIELFKMKSGADLTVVQYKGGGPALLDLVAGNVQVSLGSLIQMRPFLESGKIKLLAIAGPKRSPIVPKVPTLKEAGIDVDVSNWWALLAPAGTPDGIVGQFHDEVNEVIKNPKVQQRFASEGADAMPMSREQLAAFMKQQLAKWADVAAKTGIKTS